MDNESTINNLSQYIDIVSKMSQSCRNELLNQDILFYRGHRQRIVEVRPGIARHPQPNVGNSLVWFESSMIEEAQRKRPDIFNEDKYPFKLLTKLQHYGLPTRLLDVTTNALVALYFACDSVSSNNVSSDGEVLILKQERDYILTSQSAMANIIAHTYLISHYTIHSFKAYLTQIKNQGYFYPFSHEANAGFSEKDYLRNMATRYKPIVVLPEELTERQKRQQGAFIIFPNFVAKSEIDGGWALHDDIAAFPEKLLLHKIVIPQDKKLSIKRELSLCGITASFLFPENAQMLCEEILEEAKQQYLS